MGVRPGGLFEAGPWKAKKALRLRDYPKPEGFFSGNHTTAKNLMRNRREMT